LQSDNNKFSRRADGNKNMATEGHGRGGKKNHQQQPSKVEMDRELAEIRVRMDELALWVQQDTRSRWVYEWPMRMKEKWPVRALMAKRHQRLLKIWLRHVENLNRLEEKMVQVCEPEDGRNLSSEDDMGSTEDLKDFQEGRTKIPNCQEGNEMRSLRDLIDCQEDSGEFHIARRAMK
jgi:hypothetical protein